MAEIRTRLEILCMSSLPASIKRIGSKTTEKRWRHPFPHYKSMGAFCCHGNQSFGSVYPKTLCSLFPTPVMLHIKFGKDWPTGFRDIQVLKCGRRRTDDGPLVCFKLTLWAFGSGELKKEWLRFEPMTSWSIVLCTSEWITQGDSILYLFKKFCSVLIWLLGIPFYLFSLKKLCCVCWRVLLGFGGRGWWLGVWVWFINGALYWISLLIMISDFISLWLVTRTPLLPPTPLPSAHCTAFHSLYNVRQPWG